MRRVVIATPVSGGIPVFYVRNLLQAISAKIENIGWIPMFMMGQAVHTARSEIVMEARKLKADELVFLDKDLDVNVNQMMRLLSHEHEDIVCAMYCKKTIDTHWHVQGWSEEEEPDKNGLLRVKQAAIGFSKIRMSVFDRIAAKNPDRKGWLREVGSGEWAEMLDGGFVVGSGGVFH